MLSQLIPCCVGGVSPSQGAVGVGLETDIGAYSARLPPGVGGKLGETTRRCRLLGAVRGCRSSSLTGSLLRGGHEQNLDRLSDGGRSFSRPRPRCGRPVRAWVCTGPSGPPPRRGAIVAAREPGRGRRRDPAGESEVLIAQANARNDRWRLLVVTTTGADELRPGGSAVSSLTTRRMSCLRHLHLCGARNGVPPAGMAYRPGVSRPRSSTGGLAVRRRSRSATASVPP
jgi:hypothetical protein